MKVTGMTWFSSRGTVANGVRLSVTVPCAPRAPQILRSQDLVVDSFCADESITIESSESSVLLRDVWISRSNYTGII